MKDATVDLRHSQQNTQKAAELFSAHGDFLLNVYRRELNDEDARDLWQNLFMTLVARPVPDHVPNKRTYLYRAAVNDIIDFKRGLKLNQRKMREYLELNRQNKRQRRPVHKLIGREAILNAFKHIETNLPPAIGQALLHKYTKHMSHREIAEKMNIKKQTVDRYLSVGTKMMEQMQDKIIGEDHE